MSLAREHRDGNSTFKLGAAESSASNLDALDCYEVMQLSPNADPDIISHIHRLLAHRYHPDNSETGNGENFIRLSEAYEVLCDPEKRASYDARHRAATPLCSKIVFAESTAGARSETEAGKCPDDVEAGVKISDPSAGKGDDVRLFVGALRGWNMALCHPRL